LKCRFGLLFFNFVFTTMLIFPDRTKIEASKEFEPTPTGILDELWEL